MAKSERLTLDDLRLVSDALVALTMPTPVEPEPEDKALFARGREAEKKRRGPPTITT